MDWPTKRAAFNTRLDNLNTGPSIASLIANVDTAVQDYISKYDTRSQAENHTAYQRIQDAMTVINNLKGKYQELNDDIVAMFTQYSSEHDMTTKLIENGKLQTSIDQLKKVQREIRTDVESAVARDELLRSRETETTAHSLFLTHRPIRKESVPYLWVLAVLFIGAGLLFFHRLAPSFLSAPTGGYPWYALLTETLLSQKVLLTLLAACILTVIGLSLKVAGVF